MLAQYLLYCAGFVKSDAGHHKTAWRGGRKRQSSARGAVSDQQ
jgi:hypothetical protein